MAYKQNFGRDNLTNSNIAALTNGGDKNKDNSDGSSSGTSAKPVGEANTTAARNANFTQTPVDKGGTENMVNQVTGEEVVTDATQRAANRAAANNNLPGVITGNVYFDNTTGQYSPAAYKGKELRGDGGNLYGYKSHLGKVTKFTGMSIRDKNQAKKDYENDQRSYAFKANQATTRFNNMAKIHRSQQ
tara:strand:- start:884 stop:1447 length:564 start_codon:yes stop_codon:yes gene_type:complete